MNRFIIIAFLASTALAAQQPSSAQKQLAAAQAALTLAQKSVTTDAATIATLQAQVTTLQAQNAALQSQLAAATQPSTQPAHATTAVITQLETTGLAGEGVEVNAIKSTMAAGTWLTCSFAWDFGDPGSAFNRLPGWSAGHIYASPGTYTITLTVTDTAGAVSAAKVQVAVNADLRPSIYVDQQGSDLNTGMSPQQAYQTPAKAQSMAGDNTKILFHAGQTFTVFSTLNVNGQHQGLDRYGDGVKPCLLFSPTDGSQGTIFIGSTAANTTINNIRFDSPNGVTSGPAPDIIASAIYARGTNVVVTNCEFDNVEDAVNGSQNPSGIIVQNCTAPLLKGLRGYFCWVDGNNWSILGNMVVNTTRAHCIRVNAADVAGVLVAGNNLTKQYPVDDPGEAQKTTIDIRIGNSVYITGNVLNGSTTSISLSPGQTPDQTVNWVVYESNYIHNGQLGINSCANHVMLRNNVLDISGTGQIVVSPTSPGFTMSDLTIKNNTGLNAGGDGEFINVNSEAAPGSITITGNLYVAPDLRIGAGWNSAVWINALDMTGFGLIAGNIWPAPNTLVTPGVVNWYAPAGWMTPAAWNALPGVQGDIFANVTLGAGVFQATAMGITTGASNVAPLVIIPATTQPSTQP